MKGLPQKFRERRTRPGRADDRRMVAAEQFQSAWYFLPSGGAAEVGKMSAAGTRQVALSWAHRPRVRAVNNFKATFFCTYVLVNTYRARGACASSSWVVFVLR